MDPRPYHYEYRKPRLSNPTFQSNKLYDSIYQVGSYAKMTANIDKIPNSANSNDLFKYKINPEMQKNPYQPKDGDGSYVANRDLKKQTLNNYESEKLFQRGAQAKNVNNYLGDGPTKTIQPERYSSHDKYDSKPVAAEILGKRSSMNMFTRKDVAEASQIERQPVRSQSQQTLSTGSKEAMISNYGSRLMRVLPSNAQDFVYQRQQKPYNIITCRPRDSNAHRMFPRLTLESKLFESGQYPIQSSRNQF